MVCSDRCEVVERRARFNLSKAEKRLHLVEGFLIAMTDLDQVVKFIRLAEDGTASAFPVGPLSI